MSKKTTSNPQPSATLLSQDGACFNFPGFSAENVSGHLVLAGQLELAPCLYDREQALAARTALLAVFDLYLAQDHSQWPQQLPEEPLSALAQVDNPFS